MLYKAIGTLRPESREDARAADVRAELARVEAEAGRLAAAIASGGELTALLAALRERERRAASLRGVLAACDQEQARAARAALDPGGLLAELREQLTDWRGMLRQETGPARQALRALLASRLVFTPRGEDRDRHYAFEGPGTVSRIIAGLTLPIEGVPPG